jgi:hypothetical protein
VDRRSFLAGLVGGVAAGSVGMLVLRSPYPTTPFQTGLTDFFANNGATQPHLGTAVYPAALHDSANDLTWFGTEAWNGTTRFAQVTGYDHSTGYWTAIAGVGPIALVDDDHGTPALCLDHEGHLHAFYGSHHTDQHHSSTNAPIAGASMSGLWRINQPITGAEYTYPHPIAVSSGIKLLMRKRISASTKMVLAVVPTTALSAGVATWGTEVTLVDFGADSAFYIGTTLKVGTSIHIVATKADYADTKREHVYYFIYNTATGAVTNHDGSYSVASGSLPITLANADANCRLFTHSGGNDEGGAPALCFDTTGDPHVIFKDGTAGSYTVKHIKRTAGTWSSPVTVSTVESRYNCPVLAPLPGDWVEAWYPLDPNALFTRFGNMVRRLRSSAGTWSAEQTIVEADTVGLGNPTVVLDGHADARVMFSENLDSALDSGAGGLRSFVYGDGGLIPYVAAPADIDTVTHTLQLNADNLQLNGEDLTLGV